MIITTSNIHQAAQEIASFPIKASDTETYGLGFEDSLFSIIVTCGGESYYFNFKDYPEEQIVGLNLKDPTILAIMQSVFAQENATWIFHNAKFDLHKLRRAGIEVSGRIWCTKVHARVLQNNLMDYTLEALTKGQRYEKSSAADEYIKEHKLFTMREVEGKKSEIKDKHYDRLPFSIVSEYGLMDGHCTMELGERQMKEYESRPTLWSLRDNEIELIKVFFEMESRGVLIDPKFVLAGWEGEKRLILEAEESFRALTSLSLKDTKKKTLVQLLIEAGEKIALSDKGNPILDSDALDDMRSPLARIIQQVRYHEKRIVAFYATFMQYRDSHNAIHANCDQAGTETGRCSMSTPNLQQLSKDGDATDIYPIRGCFKPRDGHCFVQWDWKQQEYKLMADYANERGLIEKIKNGYDVHNATAELVGITRDQAKTVNFAILYGAGAAKLAIMLGISLTDAKKLIAKYFAALPMVEDFIAKVIGKGKQRGFIFNWFGRVCNVAKREWAYILPNHLIQGSGADICKVALVRISQLLRARNAKSKIVLTVHDSIILEMVPEDYYLIPEITKIMETVYTSKHGIILTTDLEHSFKSLAKRDLIKGAPNGRN